MRWLGEFNEKVSPAGKESLLPTEKEETELYDATCSSCGKKTKVPFAPDGTRPTYCKTCRKKDKKKKEEVDKASSSKEESKEGKEPSLKEALEEAKGEEKKEEGNLSNLKKALQDAFKKKK